jgi:hypothetical protein
LRRKIYPQLEISLLEIIDQAQGRRKMSSQLYLEIRRKKQSFGDRGEDENLPTALSRNP